MKKTLIALPLIALLSGCYGQASPYAQAHGTAVNICAKSEKPASPEFDACVNKLISEYSPSPSYPAYRPVTVYQNPPPPRMRSIPPGINCQTTPVASQTLQTTCY